MPNHLLATKTIVNIQRTAHQWHEFMIQVGVCVYACVGTTGKRLQDSHVFFYGMFRCRNEMNFLTQMALPCTYVAYLLRVAFDSNATRAAVVSSG